MSVPKVPGGLILMLNDGRIMDFGGFEFYEGVRGTVEGNENAFAWDLQTFYRDNMSVNTIEVDVNSATIYDFEENQWTDIEQMIFGHSNGSCVQIENRVFVV